MFKTARMVMILTAAALPAYGQTAATHPPAGASAPAAAAPAAGQFQTEPAAKSHCPGDTIVWVNLGASKVYHTSADRYYGKTRHGAYMCQKEADQAGYHAAGTRGRRNAAKTQATTSQAK
jgi:plastocyanin